MSGPGHLPGLWPVPGDGVLARHGELILLSSLESGQFVDTLLDLLGQVASSGGDGRRFADAIADALETEVMSGASGADDTDDPGPSVLAFGPAGSGLAVTVAGRAWATVTTAHGTQRIEAGQHGTLMRCLLRSPATAVRGGLGVGEDGGSHTDRFSRLDGGTVRAGGLGYYPGGAAYPGAGAGAPAGAVAGGALAGAAVGGGLVAGGAVLDEALSAGSRSGDDMSDDGVPARSSSLMAASDQAGSDDGLASPAGFDQAGSDQAGSDQAGSDQAGSDQAGSDQAGSDQAWPDHGFGSPAGSDQAGSDQAGSDQAGSNDGFGSPAGSDQAGSDQAGSNDGFGSPAGPDQAGSNQTGSEAPDAGAALAQDARDVGGRLPTMAVPIPDGPAPDQPAAGGPGPAEPWPTALAYSPPASPAEPSPTAFAFTPGNFGAPEGWPAEATQLPPAVGAQDGPNVEGVYCENGHFGDPDAMFCTSCGVAIAPHGQARGPGQRPPLGTLVLDDGSVFQLDTDYIVGREPSLDSSVISGAASPLRIADDAGIVSRVHARVQLDGWRVLLTDLGSANGTRIKPPGQSVEQELQPQIPVLLTAGSEIDLGGRGLRYEPYRGQ